MEKASSSAPASEAVAELRGLCEESPQMVRAALVHGNAAHLVSLDSGYSRNDSRILHGFRFLWSRHGKWRDGQF